AAAHLISLSSTPEKDIFEGMHDGYQRLADPVMHRRRITLDKLQRCIVIEDNLDMRGTHDVELYFHCNEASNLRREDRNYLLELDELALNIQLPDIAGA